jgi:hypothetical protein
MKEIATIQFLDVESGEESITVIRAMKGEIALCLSLKDSGDIEVFLRVEDCENLVENLKQAILVGKGQAA